MEKTYQLEGLKCQGCATTVQERFAAVPGVTAVDVSLDKKEAVVSGDVSVSDLQASLAGTKYVVKG